MQPQTTTAQPAVGVNPNILVKSLQTPTIATPAPLTAPNIGGQDMTTTSGVTNTFQPLINGIVQNYPAAVQNANALASAQLQDTTQQLNNQNSAYKAKLAEEGALSPDVATNADGSTTFVGRPTFNSSGDTALVQQGNNSQRLLNEAALSAGDKATQIYNAMISSLGQNAQAEGTAQNAAASTQLNAKQEAYSEQQQAKNYDLAVQQLQDTSKLNASQINDYNARANGTGYYQFHGFPSYYNPNATTTTSDPTLTLEGGMQAFNKLTPQQLSNLSVQFTGKAGAPTGEIASNYLQAYALPGVDTNFINSYLAKNYPGMSFGTPAASTTTTPAQDAQVQAAIKGLSLVGNGSSLPTGTP